MLKEAVNSMIKIHKVILEVTRDQTRVPLIVSSLKNPGEQISNTGVISQNSHTTATTATS